MFFFFLKISKAGSAMIGEFSVLSMATSLAQFIFQSSVSIHDFLCNNVICHLWLYQINDNDNNVQNIMEIRWSRSVWIGRDGTLCSFSGLLFDLGWEEGCILTSTPCHFKPESHCKGWSLKWRGSFRKAHTHLLIAGGAWSRFHLGCEAVTSWPPLRG